MSPRPDLVASIVLYKPTLFLQAFNKGEEIANAQDQPMKYLCALLVIETMQKEVVALGITCES